MGRRRGAWAASNELQFLSSNRSSLRSCSGLFPVPEKEKETFNETGEIEIGLFDKRQKTVFWAGKLISVSTEETL